MSSVNKVILVGNLGKDPEIRRTQDSKVIANLSVATSERWRDKSSGEMKERTEWSRVVVFNEHLAKMAEQYLHKGMKVYVEGQLATRKWQDNAGNDKYVTEVVIQAFNGDLKMMEAPKGNGEERQRPADIKPPGGNAPQKPRPTRHDDMDDEIPF